MISSTGIAFALTVPFLVFDLKEKPPHECQEMGTVEHTISVARGSPDYKTPFGVLRQRAQAQLRAKAVGLGANAIGLTDLSESHTVDGTLHIRHAGITYICP